MLKLLVMLDVVQRYAPAVKAVKQERLKIKRIVEVGGAGEGIAFYLPDYEIVDCDIEFVKNILPNVKPVKSKGDKLPLPDNYSDILVSVDMLEHLPTYNKRQRLVKEMLRVAKCKVILAVPTGRGSFEAIKKFGKLFYKKYSGIKYKYLDEHLTYKHPLKKEIVEIIKNSGFATAVRTEKNTNIKLWLLFQKLYLKFPKLYLIFRYRRFWYYLLKPVFPLCNFGKTMRTIFYINLDKN